MNIVDRFWSKVNINGPTLNAELGPCSLWTAGVDADGYGRFRFAGANQKAHRVAWYLYHGELPTENLLHRCDNTLCVKVSHLYEGNQQDNVRDREERHRRNVIHVRDAEGRFVDNQKAVAF